MITIKRETGGVPNILARHTSNRLHTPGIPHVNVDMAAIMSMGERYLARVFASLLLLTL
ncbi:MAG: hypothetical protein JWL59_131 [Chthoniobacteraceae bacterium]|nr:hypothetical protein [Chthoniobacteraceae bacterium]